MVSFYVTTIKIAHDGGGEEKGVTAGRSININGKWWAPETCHAHASSCTTRYTYIAGLGSG